MPSILQRSGYRHPWSVVAGIAVALAACAAGPQTVAPSAAPVPATAPVPAPVLLPCASLDEFKNTWTPEDSFSRMQDCIAKDDTAKASDLDTMGVIYGNYDTWRVSDEEVKNGFTVLTYLTYQGLSDSQRHALSTAAALRNGSGPAGAHALCQKILQIGPPAYIPLYMTKYHLDDQGRNVVTVPAEHVDQSQDFDISRGWKDAVNAVLHCDKK